MSMLHRFTSRRRGRRGAATAGAVALALAATAGGASARPAPETSPQVAPQATSQVAAGAAYVALGDSYSAGAGINPTRPGSPPECLRSTENYASTVATRLALVLTDVTCSGATTVDLGTAQYASTAPQLDALGDSTALVTMTMGGNDDGLFGDFVTTCSIAAATTAGTGAPCRDQNGSRYDALIDDQVGPHLVSALTAIRQRSPQAKVLVLGYPRILPGSGGCYPVMPFASGDVGYLSGIEAHLDAVVSAAAAQTGATYVDSWIASRGHDACAPADTRWIEPVVGSRIDLTIHPNLRGQRALARLVLKALGRR